MRAKLSSVWCCKCDVEMAVVDISPDPDDWTNPALYCPLCGTFCDMPSIELAEVESDSLYPEAVSRIKKQFESWAAP